ncbi:hypothetical protein [Rugamonas aquatica]|uniref:Uncharacterized protein n=1 Tax=Rugamonas aquatica TaxID=2743357 RepID=A0A6A7N6H1_9BURK|nr:hypothetical protein [Rugamonas aquatica]MQA40650.1 hypothetical protein [Rugamonas aquatica]
MNSMLQPNPLRLRPGIAGVIGFAAILLAGCSNDSTSGSNAPAKTSASAAGAEGAIKNDLELPAGEIGGKNLIAYAEGVFSSPKGDQFTKRFDDKPLQGGAFKFTVLYEEYRESLHFHYDPEKEKLKVWVAPDSTFHRAQNNDHEIEPKLDYLIVEHNSNYGTPQPMSNAFGVTTSVTPVYHKIFAVGNLRNTYIGLFPKEKYSSRDYIFYSRLEREIKISPEAGREAVKGLAMDVEGFVASGKDGHPVICKNTKTTATISYAYQETWDECVVQAKITRIAFHSPQLGMFAEWPVTDRNGGQRKR